TNKTLSQFTNNVRITHAISLLAEKGVSVSNICFECGFDNLSYFNRQFKAITGKTPLDYRKDFAL
ncbi:MAG: AraC family transcriptional regulator, partial [Bacteroidota bacterium]